MFCAIVKTNKMKNRKVDYEYEQKIFADSGQSFVVGSFAVGGLVSVGTRFFHFFYLVGGDCSFGRYVHAADIHIFSEV